MEPKSLKGESLNEPNGSSIAQYAAGTTDLIIAETADIIRSAGFTRAHIVIIGGLVPSLLVPVVDPHSEPHVGTADIDLCLSLALVEGDTAEYQRLEKTLKDLGFRTDDASFRWVRDRAPKITLEFFCPSGPNRPPGKVYRPSNAENPVAKHNMGGKLTALSLEAGKLLNSDVEIIEQNVMLPEDKGSITIKLRVTGPLAFLVAKGQALLNRDKPKDAYDIVWLIENWAADPASAAQQIAKRDIYSAEVEQQLRALGISFADEKSVGARSYARFMAASGADLIAARRAVGAVNEFLQALPSAEA